MKRDTEGDGDGEERRYGVRSEKMQQSQFVVWLWLGTFSVALHRAGRDRVR